MEDLIKRQGKTVLIVSHNIRQVERLCTRTLLLDKGLLVEDGDPSVVCNSFTKLMNLSIQADRAQRHVRELQNSGEISNVEVEFLSPVSPSGEPFIFGNPASLRFRFNVVSEIRGVAVYVGIHTSDFVYLTNNNTAYHVWDFPVGSHTVDLRFDEIALIPGVYSVLLWIGTPEGKVSYHTENLASFTVVSDDFAISRQQGQALFSLPASWCFDGIEVAKTSCLANVQS